jgi:hypothetical protein
MKEWVENKEGFASLPDNDDLASDLVSVRQIHRLDGDWLLMSKADMKKNNLRSPDLGDALALTFASNEYFPDRAPSSISRTDPNKPVEEYVGATDYGGSGGWMI